MSPQKRDKLPLWLRVFSVFAACLISSLAWTTQANLENQVKHAQPDTEPSDVLFVKQHGEEGVYSATTGEIVEVTPKYILLNKEGIQSIYTRDVVYRVVLDSNQAQRSNYQHWQRLINLYWNRNKSLIVEMFTRTPYMGNFFFFLEYLPGAWRTVLAVIILLSILLYAAYKLYEMIIIAAGLRVLNRTKLDMEVRKLSYEIENINKQLGVTTEVAFDREERQIVEKGRFPYGFELAPLLIADFVKHRLLGFLTKDEERVLADRRREKWQHFKGKNIWLPRTIYGAKWAMNVVLTIFVGAVGTGAFINIFLLFMGPTEFYAPSILAGLFFLALSVVFGRFLVRLSMRRRIMSYTYRETFTSKS